MLVFFHVFLQTSFRYIARFFFQKFLFGIFAKILLEISRKVILGMFLEIPENGFFFLKRWNSSRLFLHVFGHAFIYSARVFYKKYRFYSRFFFRSFFLNFSRVSFRRFTSLIQGFFSVIYLKIPYENSQEIVGVPPMLTLIVPSAIHPGIALDFFRF